MNHQTPNPNVQKAVAFFQQVGLSRLVEKLREKYVELGHVGGQVILENSTAAERREIASFLGKPPFRDDSIRVKLADVDKALQQSGFECTLPDVLTAFFPDTPLVTRPQQRTARATQQADFRSALLAIATALPEASQGHVWLFQGAHGIEWLFSRYKNAPCEEQERQLALVRYIGGVLNTLPGTGKPERLALFAQRTSGDPHALDANRPGGRLLLLALHDLAQDRVKHVLSLSPNSLSPLSSQDREQEIRLYNDAGLLVDTISSNVAVFKLAGALFLDGSPDPFVQAASGRVLLLPLRQLLEWQSVLPATKDVYVIENPQVFEEVIAGLDSSQRTPTLVCSAGWPSMAALRLLDLMLVSSPHTTIHYSGDFDLKGLQIASSLMARYPERCQPWHFDLDAYTLALQAGGIRAGAVELALLPTLLHIFIPLTTCMQERKQWAFQEGIASLLLADMQHSSQ